MFPQQKKQLYRFDGFTVDAARRLLLRNGQPVPVSPKAFDLLIVMVEAPGKVITKQELMERVWPDQFVEEGNLTVHMSALRKALGERKDEPRFIVTLPGRGYKFVAGVADTDDSVVIEQHTLSRVVIEQEEGDEPGEETRKVLRFDPQTNTQREARVQPRSTGSLVLARKHEAENAPEVKTAALPSPVETVREVRQPLPRATRQRYLFGVVAAAVILVIIAVAGYWYAVRSGAKQNPNSTARAQQMGPSRQMKVTRVTNNARVKSAAVSPDGKYAAYILGDAVAGDSVHLTEPGTRSDVRVLAPEGSTLSAIMFAPDGKSLYFHRQRRNETGYYKMPVLGGALENILPGVQGSMTMSPDGKRVAFLRAYPERRQTALIIANAEDGGGEQELASLSYPRNFTSEGLAWSPDGEAIAIALEPDERQQFCVLATVKVADGTITPMSTREWGVIGNLAWLNDGSGLVMIAGDDEMLDATQVWLVSYPGGEPRRITNDILRYGADISLSSSSNELIVVATQLSTNIWVSPFAEPGQAKQITFGAEGRFDGLYGLGWVPDGRIAYGAYIGYQQTIWIMNEDGSDQKQLTPGRKWISDSAIRVTPDGRYILFHSDRSGSSEIWRIDVDGGSPTQITTGGTKYQPGVSADAKWVVYRSWEDGRGLLWKAPIDGGTPVRLTDKPGAWPIVSPDGRFIACGSEGKLIVIPFDGGAPVKRFDMPPTATLYCSGAIWSPDGSAVLYRDTIQGIWRQPLSGGNPEKIPGLRSETVFHFAISPDGQNLAITYGTETSDAVLISNFR
jgi:Tol biopolymer transport system component/DNA-binding winged helix-turn-helix (wHTH) protein